MHRSYSCFYLNLYICHKKWPISRSKKKKKCKHIMKTHAAQANTVSVMAHREKKKKKTGAPFLRFKMYHDWLFSGWLIANNTPEHKTTSEDKVPRVMPWHHALNYGKRMQLWSLSWQHLCNQHPLITQRKKIHMFESFKFPVGVVMKKKQLYFKCNLFVRLLIWDDSCD